MFAFRLCMELGIIHPDNLLQELDSRQIAEWAVWFEESAKPQSAMMSQAEIESTLASVINGGRSKS